MTDSITCRKPFHLSTCLNTALKKEWRKHTATPVAVDLVPGHDSAQACGYVVAGRLLTKQGLNAVLLVRDVEPPRICALSVLFEAMPWEDRDMLRACCDDLRHALPSMPSFSLTTLGEFLVNPDEGRDSRGLCIGSFDWQCLPTEEEGGWIRSLVAPPPSGMDANLWTRDLDSLPKPTRIAERVRVRRSTVERRLPGLGRRWLVRRRGARRGDSGCFVRPIGPTPVAASLEQTDGMLAGNTQEDAS